VRRAVEQLDVFVFTLGLTEGWTSQVDGAAFPLCPGVAGGCFDASKHRFVNLRVHEVIDDLNEAIGFIRRHKPPARFILTVSPVPLVATAEPRSVLVSTSYSKSVLRVAAEEVAGADDGVAYFPSFEIITGAHNKGRYFADDLRSVTEDGVRRVMELFFRHYTEGAGASSTQPATAPSPAARTDLARAVAVICDEVALDASHIAAPTRSGHR